VKILSFLLYQFNLKAYANYQSYYSLVLSSCPLPNTNSFAG